jgi:hypothetical protein
MTTSANEASDARIPVTAPHAPADLKQLRELLLVELIGER